MVSKAWPGCLYRTPDNKEVHSGRHDIRAYFIVRSVPSKLGGGQMLLELSPCRQNPASAIEYCPSARKPPRVAHHSMTGRLVTPLFFLKTNFPQGGGGGKKAAAASSGPTIPLPPRLKLIIPTPALSPVPIPHCTPSSLARRRHFRRLTASTSYLSSANVPVAEMIEAHIARNSSAGRKITTELVLSFAA